MSEVDQDQRRMDSTDALLEAKFSKPEVLTLTGNVRQRPGPKPKNQPQQVVSGTMSQVKASENLQKEFWGQAFLAALQSLQAKTPKHLEQAVMVADAALEIFNKRWK